MILGVGLENFQGFKGYQHVKFAPITVIFGPNASGKSSISRALRILRQSGPTDDKSTTGGNVSFSGPDIELNSFTNAKFAQSKQLGTNLLAIEISGTIAIEKNKVNIFDQYTTRVDVIKEIGENSTSNKLEILTSFHFSNLEFEGEPVSLVLSLEANDPKGKVSCIPPNAWESIETYLNETCGATPVEVYSEEVSDFEDSPVMDLDEVTWRQLFSSHWDIEAWDNVLTVNSRNSRDTQSWAELHKYRVIRDAFYSARTSYRKDFWGIRHIKPFREVPARVQVASHQAQDLENESVANKWLAKLTDGRYEVVSVKSTFQSEVNDFQVTENYVRDLFTGAAVGFDEVGTGISQVFPILRELFSKPEARMFGISRSEPKLLIVEQPELHLHPRMQGDLADAVIDAVKNNLWPTQVILETHSENLLLRLQKRIREGILTKNDVSIIYVEPSDAENPADRFNIMSNIEMDEAGDVIDPFPISFASLRVEDLL